MVLVLRDASPGQVTGWDRQGVPFPTQMGEFWGFKASGAFLGHARLFFILDPQGCLSSRLFPQSTG